ncbi:MAG TPA: type 1 glutamine amidotransferase [Casimicrobiaceae bacterium]|jgi:GMP synthase-like glutamine amidotransferase|nr:type 1 glutamine amidotransferase [Casimicrobiaceae bacterium]
MQPVAIFRFSPTEGPGHFAEWIDAHGLARRLIALDEGDPVPTDPRGFSGIAMMGGPMSANDDLPWSAALLDLVRGAVAADVPVLGHCLGGQILAKALGAPVTRTPAPEIGWGEVRVQGADSGSAWFGKRDAFTTFQWHYEVFALPPGATRVLTNAHNPNQAYTLGKHIGLQCHIEMTRPMVETWCRTGAAELPASSTGATQSREDIYADLEPRLAALSRLADDVYAHWANGLVR